MYWHDWFYVNFILLFFLLLYEPMNQKMLWSRLGSHNTNKWFKYVLYITVNKLKKIFMNEKET